MNISSARMKWSVLGLLSVVTTSGCALPNERPVPYEDRKAVIKADEAYLSPDVRSNQNADTINYRNRVIGARIEVIDLNYNDFESHLIAANSSTSLGADLATLVLNGLGATTGASGAKAAFAAASAGVVGAKGAINTDVFYQKTLPALVAQMRADRAKALVIIETNIRKPITEYSLQQGLSDVNTYYVAGTLPSALTSITSQAGTQLSSSSDELAAIRKASWIAPSKGSSAAQILAWLYPGGDETKPVNSANLQALTKWMGSYAGDPVLANIPYQNLLTGSGLVNGESDRQQAIKDLNIPQVAS